MVCSISISNFWLQTAPLECGPFFSLNKQLADVLITMYSATSSPRCTMIYLSASLFHILAIFKWSVNQDLTGQSDLVYELNLLGHLHDSGNLNLIDC